MRHAKVSWKDYRKLLAVYPELEKTRLPAGPFRGCIMVSQVIITPVASIPDGVVEFEEVAKW